MIQVPTLWVRGRNMVATYQWIGALFFYLFTSLLFIFFRIFATWMVEM